jgi:cellulose synthase (UDP-forming)
VGGVALGVEFVFVECVGVWWDDDLGGGDGVGSGAPGATLGGAIDCIVGSGSSALGKSSEIRGNEIGGNEIRGNEIGGNEIRGNEIGSQAMTAPVGKPSKSQKPVKPEGLIHPVVKGLLGLSGLGLGVALFVNQWTSTGPTWLPAELHGSPEGRYLPLLLQVPAQSWEVALPVVVALLAVALLRWVPATNWTRLLVKGIFLVVLLRYWVWRSVGTLNFVSGWSTGFSVFMYCVEGVGLFSLVLNTLLSIWSSEDRRRAEADFYEQAIVRGDYLPSVDVFVPTYNEPDWIVQRTVMGCQAMDYPNKRVYILDDTRRSHIRELAEKLGCDYITRPDNAHAKAGNLNHALPLTDGDLITIMDADFVPFRNFLHRTVGFFSQPKVALVQTPQDFYNPDHHTRNLGIDHILPNDLASFFNFSQSTRDVINSVVCCGTSYVVRRAALEEVGGYYTRCTAEDSPTSTLMLTRGWEVLYLGEKLSMGESTRNYADFLKQRLRWIQGNLQIYYCADEVPIWRTMTFAQQCSWVSFLLGCFNPLLRLLMLVSPIAAVYSGVNPYVATLPEVAYYFLPFMIALVGTFAWSVNYHASYLLGEVYDTILCFPGLVRLFFTLLEPFGKPFVVTPKGVTRDSKCYNLGNTYPLLGLMGLTVAALGLHLGGFLTGTWETLQSQGFGVLLFWLTYNLMLMGLAVLAAIDQPERRLMDRFPLQTPCRLLWQDRLLSGMTVSVSEGGIEVELVVSEGDDVGWMLLMERELERPVLLELALPLVGFDASLRLCHGVRVGPVRGKKGRSIYRLGFAFEERSLVQHRELVNLLYTQMDWWKVSKQPGSLEATWAIVMALLMCRPLLSRF